MIEKLKKVRVALCRMLEAVLVLTVTALVLVVLWGVLTRYVFGKQADWSEELARFLLIWISLLGGAVAFGEKAHLGVDYFVSKFDPTARRFITAIGQLIILFFAVTIFMIGGSSIVANNIGQQAPALGVYGVIMAHVYLPLPIAGIFMILFTVEQLLETLFSDQSDEEDN